jgi:hypothetical protein
VCVGLDVTYKNQTRRLGCVEIVVFEWVVLREKIRLKKVLGVQWYVKGFLPWYEKEPKVPGSFGQNPIQITRFRADPAPIVAIERERIVVKYTVRIMVGKGPRTPQSRMKLMACIPCPNHGNLFC